MPVQEDVFVNKHSNTIQLFKKNVISSNENRCRTCEKHHHSSLHLQPSELATLLPTQATSSIPTSSGSQNTASALPHAFKPKSLTTNLATNGKSVILPLCYALARGYNGETVKVGVMLDGCSDGEYISSRLQEKLNLRVHQADFEITGVGGKVSTTRRYANCVIQALHSEFSFEFEAPILDEIAPRLPPLDLSAEQERWIRKQSIEFSEERFSEQFDVDVLIGAAHVTHLETGQKLAVPHSDLNLVESRLGWFVTGSYIRSPTRQPRKLHCNLAVNHEKFWYLILNIS